MRTRVLAAASAFAITIAVAGAASAQEYDRVVSFGDSLTDNGNLFAATGGTNPPFPYWNGRFSNGPTFVELLGFSQAGVGGPVTGSINYAYGGARTDLSAFPPGLRSQLGMYVGAGGTFDSDDLVTIWGGANNIFQGLPSAAVNPDPFGYISATSIAAAADIGLIVNQVAGAGAGTLLVPNLPNLAATPQFAGGPAQGLASHATNAFNVALFGQLQAQAAANPGANIIHMDVYKAFEVVRRAPGRFGFSNITAPCFNGVTVCANPDDYVYWDGVHPTAAGHRLLAALATDHIYYLNFGAHSALQGELGMRQRSDGLDVALDRVGMRDFSGLEGGLLVGGGIGRAELDARGVIPEADVESQALRIAFENNLTPNFRGGVAFTAEMSEVDAGLVNFDVESVAFDVYGGWRSGAVFVNAAAGFSQDRYDEIVRRTAMAGSNLGHTDGSSAGARVQTGMFFDMGGMTLSPRAGLSWVRTEVDGYREEGEVTALHEVSERTVEAVSAEVAVRLEGGGERFGGWFEAGYRDNLSYDGDPVTVGLVGNTARPLSMDVGDPEGGQVLLGAGVRGRLTDNLSLTVGYRGRMGDSFDSHLGGAALVFSF